MIFIYELVDFYENDEEGRHDEETGDVLILHEICKYQIMFYNGGSRISERREFKDARSSIRPNFPKKKNVRK